MISNVRHWLLIAVLTGLALPGGAARPCRATEPAPAASAGPVPETLPPPSAEQDRPPAYILPPVDHQALPVFTGLDPLLDRPTAPLPGFFFDVETSVVKPDLRNQLIGPIPITATRTDTVQFTGNKLNWTVTPRFEFGYRLPDGWGALQVGYRFLSSEGSGLLSTADGVPGPSSQKGRLDLNIVDLDYVSREFALGPNWEMRWTAGARGLYLFFDSQVSVLSPSSDPGSVLRQLETNSVWAYGFHGVFDLSRKTPIPGLAVFARIEGSGMVGRINQVFTERLTPAADSSIPAFAQVRFNRTIGLPTLSPQVGLSYTLPEWNHSRVLLGWEYEVFWDIGRVADTLGRAQLETQGVFIRAEFNF